MRTPNEMQEIPQGVFCENYIMRDEATGQPVVWIKVNSMFWDKNQTDKRSETDNGFRASGSMYMFSPEGELRDYASAHFTNAMIQDNWEMVVAE